MAKIQILVGSVNGTAWQSAQAVAHVLNHQGHQVRVNDEPLPQHLEEDTNEVLLVCCSTTGQGDLPHNIMPLFLALDDQQVDLKDRHYGVIALGDSGYPHFAQGGYIMESALYGAGARRIGDVFTLDAKRINNHPLAAAQWANQWVGSLPA